MNIKIWHEEIPVAEWEELTGAYNTSNLERFKVDPPMNTALIQKIKEIEGVGESDELNSAVIISVSPTEILIDEWCSLCGWELVKKIREVLKQEEDLKS